MATPTDDFTNDSTTTGKLALDLPSGGKFESSVDTDWFGIDLVAGARYVFTMQSPRSSDYWNIPAFTLAVHDAAGGQVGELVTGAGSGMPAIDFTAPATGKYYVAAGSKYSSIEMGSYSLLAVRHPGSDDFSADMATVGRLTANSVVSGVFNVVGDRDWIRFHAVPTSHYAISTESGVYAATTRIFDTSGKLMDEYAFSIDVAKEGDYFLEVLGLQTGAYTMALKEWKDDFPGTNAGAGVIVPGGQLSASLDYQRDVDNFQVRLEAGKYYTVSVAAAYGQLPSEIHAPSGAWAGSTNYMTGKDGTTFLAKESGTYFISTTLPMTTIDIKEAVPYTVKVNSGVLDDVGNTRATAAAAQVGISAHGILEGSGDADVFKVALQGGVTYAFAAQEAAAGGTHQLVLDVAGADGQAVGHAGIWLADYYTVTPAASGDYYVTVGPGEYGAAANFAYTLDISKPADDAGASAAGAVSLPIGATLSGKLEQGGGDIDWYAVNLVAGTTYWFDAEAVSMSNESDGLMRLLDSSGAELMRARSTFFSSFSDPIAFKPSTSGTYYLAMSSPDRTTGGYTVSAKIGETDDAGESAQTAAALVPGAPVSGKLELGSDKDMYKISGTPGMTYIVTAEPDVNGNPDITMVDGGGKTLPFSKLYTSFAWPERLLFTAPAEGDAYVLVSQKYGDRGTGYKLTATAYAVDDYSADKDTVGRLSPGTGVQGMLSHPTDGDWVRTSLEAGKTYAFQLLGADSGGGTLASTRDFKLSVVGDGYTWTGVTADAIKNAVEARVMFTPAKTGDYFVSVGGYDYSLQGNNVLGSYTLRALQTTGDTAGPALAAQSHAQDATGVEVFATRFTLRFNEPVSVDLTAIDIRDSQGRKLSLYGAGPYVNNDTVAFKVFDVLKPGSYTVQLPHDAIYDLAGNAYTGPETIRFTTRLPVAAGTPAADLLVGGDGVTPVTLDGGAGIDTVMYGDNYFYRYIERTETETRVTLSSGKAVDVFKDIERLQFGDRFYAVDIDGNGGQAYRLYQAAFNRRPDSDGLGYWIGQLDKGLTLHEMARGFVASAEFKSLYGAAPSDDAFLTQLYNNVLHRAPEPAGYTYWIDLLHGGLPREEVLASFGESTENKAAVLEVIGGGFEYTPYSG